MSEPDGANNITLQFPLYEGVDDVVTVFSEGLGRRFGLDAAAAERMTAVVADIVQAIARTMIGSLTATFTPLVGAVQVQFAATDTAGSPAPLTTELDGVLDAVQPALDNVLVGQDAVTIEVRNRGTT